VKVAVIDFKSLLDAIEILIRFIRPHKGSPPFFSRQIFEMLSQHRCFDQKDPEYGMAAIRAADTALHERTVLSRYSLKSLIRFFRQRSVFIEKIRNIHQLVTLATRLSSLSGDDEGKAADGLFLAACESVTSSFDEAPAV
jgi:hypothetical protein